MGNMAEWLVKLRGEEYDLELLKAHLGSPSITPTVNVTNKEGGYYIRSARFSSITDQELVRERAEELVDHLNKVATLLLGTGYSPVEEDGIFVLDGENLSMVSKSLRVSWSVRGELKQTTPEGVEKTMKLVLQDPRFEEALHFFMKSNWVNLYKAWEIAGDVAGGGYHQLIKNGWADEPTQGRFTGTAQSREELGEDARHASEKYKPPKSPMSLSEAQDFVRSVLLAWADSMEKS